MGKHVDTTSAPDTVSTTTVRGTPAHRKPGDPVKDAVDRLRAILRDDDFDAPRASWDGDVWSGNAEDDKFWAKDV